MVGEGGELMRMVRLVSSEILVRLRLVMLVRLVRLGGW